MNVTASIVLVFLLVGVFLLVEAYDTYGNKVQKKCPCRKVKKMMKVLEGKLNAKIDAMQEAITALQETEDEEEVLVVNECSEGQTDTGIFTNVALNKPVILSSMWANESHAGLLVDGIRQNKYPCTHSEYEPQPFMKVDLGQVYDIHSIYVLNRGDCCQERLFNLTVYLGGEKPEKMIQRVYHEGVIGAECTFVLPQIPRARYLRLEINGETWFTVCELEVYSQLP